MNEAHHYDMAICNEGNTRQIIVRRRIGSLARIVAQASLPEGLVILRIDADRECYRFSYAVQGEGYCLLASGETRYLATEVAGGFTGVYFGLYTQRSGNQSADPAYFDWFDYLPV